MDETTRCTLSEVNRRFYREAAEEFSGTRTRAWAGWSRVLERAPFSVANKASEDPLIRVLDVGCGNGRFGSFIDRRLTRPFGYLGLDSSRQLLRIARRRLTACKKLDLQLLEVDLERGDLATALGARRFEAIAVFGVLHHIPGFVARRKLLQELTRYLAPGGLLALSFWQFATRKRFENRILDWDEMDQWGLDPVEPEQLEPGDYLLRWGPIAGVDDEDASQRWRYCHHASDAEIGMLVSGLGLECEERYRADGVDSAQNRYELLRG